MRFWTIPLTAVSIVVLYASLHAFQLPFREYPAIEYNNFPLPPDYQQKSEFVFARLMYPPAPTARFDRTSKRLVRLGWKQSDERDQAERAKDEGLGHRLGLVRSGWGTWREHIGTRA